MGSSASSENNLTAALPAKLKSALASGFSSFLATLRQLAKDEGQPFINALPTVLADCGVPAVGITIFVAVAQNALDMFVGKAALGVSGTHPVLAELLALLQAEATNPGPIVLAVEKYLLSLLPA